MAMKSSTSFRVLSTLFSSNPRAMTARLSCRRDGHLSFRAAFGTGSWYASRANCCSSRRVRVRNTDPHGEARDDRDTA